jgi:hypothetical protein
MWYTAASVIRAIKQCGQLTVAAEPYIPSCPKNGNNIHCLTDFPGCEGKNQQCFQRLYLVNEGGHPIILNFEYYLSKGERDGRIKQKNTTLTRLIRIYQIDERLMIPTPCIED